MPSPSETAKNLGIKKIKSEITSKIMDEMASDGITGGSIKTVVRQNAEGEFESVIEREATKTVANSTVKIAAGFGMLFLEFVDAYSKAVAKAELENVQKNIEVCPHIGQCENNGHAMRMAHQTSATVWQYRNYWYFHPQWNYDVQKAQQIYRTTMDNGWRIEQPGKSLVPVDDCWGCLEAHLSRLLRK